MAVPGMGNKYENPYYFLVSIIGDESDDVAIEESVC